MIASGATNSLGEAEHTVFFYMIPLSQVLRKLAIVSEDADTILKSIATTRERYCVRKDSKLHVLAPPKGDQKEFVTYDIDKCVLGMQSHSSLSHFRYPVETVVFNLLDMGCGDYVESVHNMSPAFSLQVLMSLVHKDLVSKVLDEETKSIVDALTYPPPFNLYPSFQQYKETYKCRYVQKNISLFRKEIEPISKVNEILYRTIQAKIWLHKEQPHDHLPNLQALQLKYQRACVAFFLCMAAKSPSPILPQGDMTNFGFCRINEQQLWSVANTKMNFGVKSPLDKTCKKDPFRKCQAILQRGQRIGQQCNAHALLNTTYCGRHKAWNESSMDDDTIQNRGVKHPASPTSSTQIDRRKKLRVPFQDISNTDPNVSK